MKKKLYASLAEAEADGWQLMDCAYGTRYCYYYRNGDQLREDKLVGTP